MPSFAGPGFRGPRRALLATGFSERGHLLALLGSAGMGNWDVRFAGSLEHARFLLQHQHCDVLLADNQRGTRSEWRELAWIADQRGVPTVLLVEPNAQHIATALANRVHQWLPRELVPCHPELLAAALLDAVRHTDEIRRRRVGHRRLDDSRRQVGRLLELLWQTTVPDGQARLCSQRHVLERLDEEIARAERYGTPLSVALAEVRSAVSETMVGSFTLDTWAAKRLLQTKRRSDVAGQYGPHGIMLLLAQTPEDKATLCCQRLQEHLEMNDPGFEELPPIRSYFGVASYSDEVKSVQRLLGRAEERLEAARAGIRA
jgi:diguanylate cyclase (GGDEF)-like protein